MKLYPSGEAQARRLIDAGDVDETADWSFDASDEDAILGDPPDWTKYGSWHLGQDDAADRETKAHWKYPYGKNGKLYRSALRAIRTRAAQQNQTDISDAARRLLDRLDERASEDALRAPNRPTAETRQWYRITAKAEAPEAVDVLIYDTIGGWFEGVTAKRFVQDLQALPDAVKTIRVHVNSPGGDVFDAVAIANALRVQSNEKNRRVEMAIEGLAASAATIVTNGGGDAIRIADNALVMIHNPWTLAFGTAKDMRDTADMLDRVEAAIITSYQRHSPLSREQLRAMMEAITWMDADEALANGFATEKVEGLRAAALLDPQAVAKLSIPDRFRARVAAFVKQADPAPAPSPASAAEILTAVEAAGLGTGFARELIAAALPMAEVTARIAAARTERTAAETRATEIRTLCALAKTPQLAEQLIRSQMALADVKAHLATVKALTDRAEIETRLRPDADCPRQPALTLTEIYDRYNQRGTGGTK